MAKQQERVQLSDPLDAAQIRRLSQDMPPSFDIIGRVIAIAREKTGDRKYLAVELHLEEDGGVLKVVRHQVLDRSYHRLGAEEKAQLAIVRRGDGGPEPKHRCEWPIGYRDMKVEEGIPCNRPAILTNKTPLTPQNFKVIPAVVVKPHFKLCEDHAELMRDSFKQETVTL